MARRILRKWLRCWAPLQKNYVIEKKKDSVGSSDLRWKTQKANFAEVQVSFMGGLSSTPKVIFPGAFVA